jgi:hypothetical protein
VFFRGKRATGVEGGMDLYGGMGLMWEVHSYRFGATDHLQFPN